MTRLFSILRCVFVSPEFLICAIGLLAYTFLPEQLGLLSSRIGNKAELLKYLGLLPLALLAYDAKIIREILMPVGDKRSIFQKWDMYGEFKSSCVVALIYALLFGVAGAACLLFDWKTPWAFKSIFLLTSLAGALATSSTLYFTNIKVEELFRQHSSHAP